LQLRPDYFSAHSNLLHTLNYHTGYTPPMRLAEARRYGANVHAHAVQMTHGCASETRSGQGLRVGLVSGDFKLHPVGFFLESVLPHLSNTGITLIAYSTQNKPDALTARIQPHFAAWRSIAHLSDAAAAEQIHVDGIHILIDLAGHTALNRLPVFAYKPAPIQVSWLGYGASTGVLEMDYLLADPISLPVELQANFSEQICYLPDTRLCFTPPADAPTVSALPAFKNGHLTFGCVQNSIKLNDQVLALWGQILRALPDAKLRLQNKQLAESSVHQTLLQRLAKVGITAERVILAPPVPRDAYLHSYAEVDILLDTFPFAGGTTTCEALWMGVPTVTLANDTFIGRQGASMMNCVGLPDWVAHDAEAYVRIALNHAGDREKLAVLRTELRARAQPSPLFDAARFAQNLSTALQGMWQKHSLR
jgi:protein O-GlcNAc transferase